MAIGNIDSLERRPKEGILYRESGLRWVFGDYTPTRPGAAFKAAPFKEDAEIFVAAMAMTHDCVCDVPAVQMLFLEGEMTGDIDNAYLILIYDLADDTLMRKLDELGVLFLYDDDGCVTKDDFEPYFPPRSIHTYHDKAPAGPLLIDLAVPLPLLEHFKESDITAARALNKIYSRFPALDCDFFRLTPLLERWETFEMAFKFANLPSKEETEAMRKARAEEEVRRREERNALLREEREKAAKRGEKITGFNLPDREESRRKQREGFIRKEREEALVKIFDYIRPLADASRFLCSTYTLDETRLLDKWKEKLDEYPVMLGTDEFGFAINEEDRIDFARRLQDFGKLIGVDPSPYPKDSRLPMEHLRPIPLLSTYARKRQTRLDEGGVLSDSSWQNWLEDSGQVLEAECDPEKTVGRTGKSDEPNQGKKPLSP